MSPRLPRCLEVKFENPELDRLIAKAKDWAIMHGNNLFKLSNVFPHVLHFQESPCDLRLTSVLTL